MGEKRIGKFLTGSRVYSAFISVTIIVSGNYGAHSFPLDNQLISANIGNTIDTLSQEDVTKDSHNSTNSLIGVSVLSILILIALIIVVANCSGGCWPLNKIFRNRQPEYPTGFSNPIAEGSGGLSQIDVNGLELDPVVFEPLPTLRNLSPHGERFQTIHQSFEPHGNTYTGPIVPFTADETNIYAHDWFDEPFHNFPRGNLEYFKEVGKAWFGLVIEAEARDIVPFAKKIQVIVKVLREDASGPEQMRFLDESRIYRESDHGNVLKLLGHSIEITPFLLIMESFPLGNLKSFLIANVTRAEILNIRGDVLRMGLDIAKGLEWMAANGFAHGDLSARNCQVGSEGRIVIGDYGLATNTFKDDYYWSSNIAIPLRWASPETIHCTSNTIQTLKVTNASNIWTFGVCLWEICEFGKLPYFELNDDDVITRVILEKNYILGHPTMPSLSMRENLCDIMKGCWKINRDERPSMSEHVKALEKALQELQVSRRSKNEFDTKWEQLAAGNTTTTNALMSNISPTSTIPKPLKSPNELGKRKSVSFFGEIPLTQVNGVDSTPFTIGMFEQNSMNSEARLFAQNTSSDVPSILKISDPEDELWKDKIERGEISQKVREKSQSVQDLMILTHVEPSDLSEPDSFIAVQRHPSNMTSPASSTRPSPILRKSSSETALNVSPQSSSHPLEKENSLKLPRETSKALTKESVSNITINIVQPTPSPGIPINIIEPTPSPSVHDSDFHTRSRTVQNIKKRFKFIFDDEDSFQSTKTRHTSTPIKSSSHSPPGVLLNEGSFESSSVFQTSNDGIQDQGNLDESFPISPITKESSGFLRKERLEDSKSEFSIVLGASDEFGLQPYQSLTTEITDSSLSRSNNISPDTKKGRNIFDGLPSTESKLFDCSFGSEPDEQAGDEETECPAVMKNEKSASNFIPRKLIFEEDGARSSLPVSQSWSLIQTCSQEHSDELTNSWNIFSKDGSKIIPSLSPPDGPALTSAPKSNSDKSSCQKNGEGATMHQPCQEVEKDEFWLRQINSLKEATVNTIALCQLGLDQDQDKSDRRGSKFIEDIVAATEETDSLIYHDLDGETDKQSKIVAEPISCSDFEEHSPSKASGMAFGGSVKAESLMMTESASGESASGTAQKDLNRTYICGSCEEGDESDGERQMFPDFVPSMWNQNLAPVKPSIKSPEILETNDSVDLPAKRSSEMRKSVSFERKKTQLVYEYPPQVISDSEEEDMKRKPMEFGIGGPLALALDWELQPDELEDAQFTNDDWDDEIERPVKPKTGKLEDVYKISGVDDSFHVCGSSQPFLFTPLTEAASSAKPLPLLSTSPSSIGELRHTRDKLKLDLSRGEASDEDMKNTTKLDSGVGSGTSTNMSPFNNCDN